MSIVKNPPTPTPAPAPTSTKTNKKKTEQDAVQLAAQTAVNGQDKVNGKTLEDESRGRVLRACAIAAEQAHGQFKV